MICPAEIYQFLSGRRHSY